MLFIFLRVFPHFSVRFSFLLNSGHHRGGQSQNEHNTIPLFSQTTIFSRACTSEALFALPLFFSSLQPTNVLLAKLFFFGSLNTMAFGTFLLGCSTQWHSRHASSTLGDLPPYCWGQNYYLSGCSKVCFTNLAILIDSPKVFN